MSNPVELPRWMDLVLLPAINLGVALLVSAVVLVIVGHDPVQVLGLLVKGAFGSRAGFSYTLYYATTFVFTGLAVAVAFHGGLFNIGGEGQAMVGGLGAALAALGLSAYLPAWLMLPLMVAAAMLFGLAWAAVPAALQAWRGSHIVITTIMFNFLAAALLGYLLVGVLKEPGNMAPETAAFGASARMPGWHELMALLGIDWPKTPLNLSVLLAVLAAVGVYLALFRSQPGYALRAVGFSPEAARYAGIEPRTQIMRSMMLSGALAALVAINELAGVQG
ncbi:MAG: ABC transporter permease, partial [Aquabacterium sp.]